jgi:hypothetical protein
MFVIARGCVAMAKRNSKISSLGLIHVDSPIRKKASEPVEDWMITIIMDDNNTIKSTYNIIDGQLDDGEK